MAFTADERAGIEPTVGDLVARRQPPPHLQDQLRLELEIDGHRVRIWSIRRIRHAATDRTVRSAIAQFTYTRTQQAWTLYWMRQDGRWPVWRPAEHLDTLGALVRVVDEDREGGFWG